MRELGGEDQNAQCVDEADHHRTRNETLQFRNAQRRHDDLNDTGEQHSGNEVIQAIVAGHRGDDESDGAGGGGDHRGTTAGESDDDGHDNGGEQAHCRVDAGEDGEGDGFRNQC